MVDFFNAFNLDNRSRSWFEGPSDMFNDAIATRILEVRLHQYLTTVCSFGLPQLQVAGCMTECIKLEVYAEKSRRMTLADEQPRKRAPF